MNTSTRSLSIVSILSFVVAGCSISSSQEVDVNSESSTSSEVSVVSSSSSEQSSSSEPRLTKNVMYTGTVRPAGISIYQQGTHRLVLDDSRFILLQSDTVDLNGYVDEKAEVYGDTQSTVEAGATIMTVKKINLLDTDSSSSEDTEEEPESIAQDTEEQEPESSSSSSEESSTSEEIEPEPSSESASESTVSSKQAEETSSSSSSSVASVTVSAEATAIESMAKDSYQTDRWSREYCSSHIGFCIPVHSNWWFKSFGTTSSALWHVEISNEEVENLGDGVIVVQLVSGSIGSKKATDGQVRLEGSNAVGYKEWDDSRHFEITGPNGTRPAVEFITNNLKVTQ